VGSNQAFDYFSELYSRHHLSKSWDHITQLGTLWQCGECPKIMHCICGISPEHNALS
ncbi:hypothetical protein B0H12DRAFT_1145723, partial [Mycena haematopus]